MDGLGVLPRLNGLTDTASVPMWFSVTPFIPRADWDRMPFGNVHAGP